MVESNDEVALAAAIEKLLSDERLRKEMGRKAREIVLSEHSLQRMTSEYEDAYLQLFNPAES